MIAYQFCFVFRRERNRSIDKCSICLFRRERNDCVPLHFSYHFFSCSIILNETVLFEVFLSECNIQRSATRTNTERSGTIAFPCEGGLRLRAHECGSILDLFSCRSDPYRSRVGATDMDPIQSSADVKRGFPLCTENPCI